jgi:serine/threonine protein kinase
VPTTNHSPYENVRSSPDHSYANNSSQVDNSWQNASDELMQKLKDVPQIKASELVFTEKIGKGSFGQVWKGKWRSGFVAIKQVLESAMTQRSKSVFLLISLCYVSSFFFFLAFLLYIDLEEFWKEAVLLSKLRPHSNTVRNRRDCQSLFISTLSNRATVFYSQVRYLGICLQPTCMVTEYLVLGDLFTYLHSTVEITSDVRLKWFRGIAAGMHHLTLEGVVHRDLAARNVLLDATLEPKISDFGMSRRVESDAQANETQSDVGPVRWVSLFARRVSQQQRIKTHQIFVYGNSCVFRWHRKRLNEFILRNLMFGPSEQQVRKLLSCTLFFFFFNIPFRNIVLCSGRNRHTRW